MPLKTTLAERRLLHDPRLLPLLFLPWTLLSVCLVKTYQTLHQRRIRDSSRCAQRPKVLITGFSSPAALHLARAFYAAGHVVVAVDYERPRFTSSARISRAVHTFYTLPAPALAKRQADADVMRSTSSHHRLLSIVLHERPDVWISCDEDWGADLAVLKRVLDHQASLPEPLIKCRVVAPDQDVLRLASDEVAFADHVRGLGGAFRAPEVYVVKSRHDLHWILSGGKSRQFLASRLESRKEEAILLPKPTINETYNCVAELDISKTSPWILRELIHGDAYRAHALLGDGRVVSFVVSRPVSSAEDDTRVAVPPGSPIQKTLLSFTQSFAAALPDHPLTHLTIDFVLSAAATDTGIAYRAYPVACSAGPPALVSLVDLSINLTTLYLYAASSTPRAKSDSTAPNSHVERCIQRFNGSTTPPSDPIDAPAIVDKSFPPLSAPILTPPNTPSTTVSRSPPRARRTSNRKTLPEPNPGSHLLPATLKPSSSLAGTYSLPRTLQTHLVAPLRNLLLHPLCGGGPAEVVGGLFVLAERLASRRWREERWSWADAGTELWEWGVRAPVTALWGVFSRA
ncbi:hypothetical protein HDK90DRAFT_120376 [Phyllosticta capitalensis]|uniref:ATP-grasp domain-containing protein n=1 Tax=Phyllosticta capitalensis TaxID=121624 RepID=A0ABR1Y941_9PEZI